MVIGARSSSIAYVRQIRIAQPDNSGYSTLPNQTYQLQNNNEYFIFGKSLHLSQGTLLFPLFIYFCHLIFGRMWITWMRRKLCKQQDITHGSKGTWFAPQQKSNIKWQKCSIVFNESFQHTSCCYYVNYLWTLIFSTVTPVFSEKYRITSKTSYY